MNWHFAGPSEVFIYCSPVRPDILVRHVSDFPVSMSTQPWVLDSTTIDLSERRGGPAAPMGVDAVSGFLAKIVAWLNAGYPDGVPGPDRVPLLALLTRRLTNDEVKAVAQDLMDRGEFDHTDIGVLILQITDELPSEDDVDRVRERLAAKGWPLDDPRDATDDAGDSV